MVIQSKDLIFLKKDNKSIIRPKYFINKMNVNSFLLKNNIDNDFVSNNTLKISFYRFLKVLKLYKAHIILSNSSPFLYLGWKLQVNGFSVSFEELTRKAKTKALRQKVLNLKNEKIVLTSFYQIPLEKIDCTEQTVFKGLATGFDKFEKFYGDYSKLNEERQIFLKTLKRKRFFNRVFMSRLYFFAGESKKFYKNSFFYLLKRKRKINSLFHVYTLSSLKFKEIKKQKKRIFKRLAWKIKKEKKWRRQGVFGLFRQRQKLSQVFYVPKHFEINYKTLSTIYMGYTDFKTTNTQIVFWLNLRRLLTFLS